MVWDRFRRPLQPPARAEATGMQIGKNNPAAATATHPAPGIFNVHAGNSKPRTMAARPCHVPPPFSPAKLAH